MAGLKLEILPIESDPDLKVGGILTLERADGRSVWRQRLVVVEKGDRFYRLAPCDV